VHICLNPPHPPPPRSSSRARVRDLYLQHNRLKELPTLVKALSALEHLDLRGNLLDSL